MFKKKIWRSLWLPGMALFAALAVAACGGDDDDSADPTATATGAAQATATSAPQTTAPPSGEGFLLVADPAASQIHFYTLPAMELGGTLEGIRFDNHLGAFALEDGRVVLSDGIAQEILVVAIDGNGRPSIAGRAAATLGGGGVWGAVDGTLTYAAITSGIDDTSLQVVNIFDLRTYKNVAFPVEMAADEELHAWIVNDTLVAGVGGELRAWPLADALRGEVLEPSDTLPVGNGSHGLVTSHERGTIHITTSDGLEGVQVAKGRFGTVTVIPWAADGLSGGRNARPRLSADGGWVYGAIAGAGPTEPENWAQRQQDIHMAHLADGTARRINLAKGAAIRFQLSKPFAMFATVEEGGHAVSFLDVQPDSATFQQIVGRVELASLLDGFVPGQPTSGKQSRSTAITPDGRFAFASHGNEAKISVIDTATMEVIAQVTTPSPLRGGGYLMALQQGTAPWDPAFR